MQELFKQQAAYLVQQLSNYSFEGEPDELYAPIRYMLSLGGKRVRPTLCLLAAELFGGNKEEAIYPALSIEVFHNFTLIHDDIMDEAPLRRGKETVHKKWNRDIAILSGDVMFVKAYELLAKSNPKHLSALLQLFNKTAIEVCEGQQMDMNFESQENVDINSYLKMIEMKTAVLLACSLKMGAITADASEMEADAIYEFGRNLGIAFQLQDDYLDTFGQEAVVGKRIGGDIISNKKTFLMLSAIEQSNQNQLQQLLLAKTEKSEEKKIALVMEVYYALDIEKQCLQAINDFHHKAMQAMEQIKCNASAKEALIDLAEKLLHRKS